MTTIQFKDTTITDKDISLRILHSIVNHIRNNQALLKDKTSAEALIDELQHLNIYDVNLADFKSKLTPQVYNSLLNYIQNTGKAYFPVTSDGLCSINANDTVLFSITRNIYHRMLRHQTNINKPLVFKQMIDLLRPLCEIDAIYRMRFDNTWLFNALDSSYLAYLQSIYITKLYEIIEQLNSDVVIRRLQRHVTETNGLINRHSTLIPGVRFFTFTAARRALNSHEPYMAPQYKGDANLHKCYLTDLMRIPVPTAGDIANQWRQFIK